MSGASVFDCAIETLLTLERKGDRVTLSCAKQKDDVEFENILLRIQVVPVGEDERGDAITSCVLVLDEVGTSGSLDRDEVTGRQRALCQLLWEIAQRGSADASTLAKRLGYSDSEFGRVTKHLRTNRYLEEVGSSRPKLYKLTERGISLISQDIPGGPNGTCGTKRSSGPKSQPRRPPKGARAGTRTNSIPAKSAKRKTRAEASHA
jgi:hypothetical protein